jgi:hypothetical protein
MVLQGTVQVVSLVAGIVATGVMAAAAAPTAAPSPNATPAKELREIGRVRARTPYCTAFETHFNASAHALLDHDQSIGAVDFTLGDVTKTFDQLGGDLRRIDDRRKLAAYADQLMRDIAPAQAQIDALRAASALTTDQDLARSNRELARQMQRALDRQKQIATDTLGVVRVLMEYDSGVKSASASHLPGSYDEDKVTMPADSLDVKKQIRLQELRDRIGDAESSAADIADTIQSRC